ncbi:proline--tRNA ligase [Candidatus Woesearchaeota archaeon]|nr:proline--tRNA ligase [Candidatus Woesearchaeota archaeon]
MEKKDKESSLGITVKKSEDISEWYSEVVIKSELVDYSAVSGCLVFRPYSYAIWEIIVAETDKRLKKLGVQNVYFPLFIPESLLKKEAKHVEGFSPEVAWVTEAGDTKLNERLAIRPTSETIMYDSYAKWIRSWRDLPIKYNQWNNVVRWEFKHPVPLIRTREFLWCEGHTVFATKEEAEKEIFEILHTWEDICTNYLALPYVKGRKSESEKFAGAVATYSLEFLLPNGRAAQGPDAHFDGQNFAKAFDITFLNREGNKEFAWQNTWAITTRMLGIMVLMHGDDKGLILPPKVAPVQVVIVPILFDATREKVLREAHSIAKELGKHVRVKLDDRTEYNPGWKYNEWEMKGVPLRIELGPKDVEHDQAVLVRRDTGKKETIKIASLSKKIEEALEHIHTSLFEKAEKFLYGNIVDVRNFKDLGKAIKDKKMAHALFCGDEDCEAEIKEKTGATSRVIPFDQKPVHEGKCVNCGKDAKFWIYFAKNY